MRYFLDISYDGTDYHGWQTQPNARTVQEILNKCLATILQQPVETVGSGRTDTGVHAAQQLVHFDVNTALPEPEALCYRLNRMLPPDISANNIYPVGPAAHARFDAVARTYEYHITQKKNPFRQRYAHYLSRPISLELLNLATAHLLTHEDFTSFSKVKGDTLHYRCQILAANWQETEKGLVFTIKANRFLRGMVRLVVGTLLDAGAGKISPTRFKQILAAQDRRQASGAAPAAGLFLTQVTYPDNYFAEQKESFHQNKTSALL